MEGLLRWWVGGVRDWWDVDGVFYEVADLVALGGDDEASAGGDLLNVAQGFS